MSIRPGAPPGAPPGDGTGHQRATESAPRRSGVHRAWFVAAAVVSALIAAAGFRSSTGALIEPLEATFGWSRTTTSGAVTVNLVLFGVTAPFAAALMDRFGIRRVLSVALVLVSLGSGLTIWMTAPWQLWILWGLLVGVGTGAMALVLGSIVANRWFQTRRGLVTGVFSAASSTGQLVFLPAIATLAEGPGWRYAAGLTSVAALALVPIIVGVVRDWPADVGVPPYGSDAIVEPPARHTGRGSSPAARAIQVLREAGPVPAFWVLAGTFFVCGWSTNGLIGTHFIPAAHDHGMPAKTAASLLALIGIFDILGTVASGWLTDRVDPRLLLAVYYALRGLSLLVVPAVLGPDVQPSLFLFIVFYGLDWVATVPPTMALCRIHFGLERSSVVFGWVFASHMVGAGIAAAYAGWMRESTGDYFAAWLTAGGLCVLAAAACYVMPRRREPIG
ncbi:MAG: MFS transporter [Actinomycetales bacterium]|jgi:MFS family permease|nr:MFS transporter [Actinomycetales bacterium]HMT32583.1 MFS transporter [Dermatophilaceae bacterium]